MFKFGGVRVRGATVEVVGVAGTGKYQNVWQSPRGAVFRPVTPAFPSRATILVRRVGVPFDVAQTVQRVIPEANPDVAAYDVRPIAEHLDNGSAVFVFRLGALVASVFGGVGVLLASIGLYGMIAYHVSQRTQEFGTRMALGARTADILRDVLSCGGPLCAHRCWSLPENTPRPS